MKNTQLEISRRDAQIRDFRTRGDELTKAHEAANTLREERNKIEDSLRKTRAECERKDASIKSLKQKTESLAEVCFNLLLYRKMVIVRADNYCYYYYLFNYLFI